MSDAGRVIRVTGTEGLFHEIKVGAVGLYSDYGGVDGDHSVMFFGRNKKPYYNCLFADQFEFIDMPALDYKFVYGGIHETEVD